MWSHYSDSHKGVCLKFDILKSPDFFIVPVKVDYDQEFGPLKYIGAEDDFLKKTITRKSIIWEHEEEIRILKPKQAGLIEFEKESLIEITFGYNTKDAEIKYIKKLLAENGYSHVRLEKATLKDDEYGLGFNDV